MRWYDYQRRPFCACGITSMTDYTNTAEQEWEAKLAERVVELLPQVMGWYRVPNAVVTSPEVVELLVESVEKQQAEIERLLEAERNWMFSSIKPDGYEVEIQRLQHDLDRQMSIANEMCNENAKLQAVADAAGAYIYRPETTAESHKFVALHEALTTLKEGREMSDHNDIAQRIRLAEAMGWKWSVKNIHYKTGEWVNPEDWAYPNCCKREELPFNPFTNANDDYAVLEWMRKQYDDMDYYIDALEAAIGVAREGRANGSNNRGNQKRQGRRAEHAQRQS